MRRLAVLERHGRALLLTRPGRGLRGLGIGALSLVLGCPDRPLDDARSALEAGRLEEAGQAFLAAARRDPAHLAAWDGAVDVWCQRTVHVARCLEVLDLELDLLGSITRHHDALATSLEARARARMASGLARSALDDLARATRAAPERSSVWVATARAHAMLGDRNSALAALDEARRRDPKNAEAKEVLGTLPGPSSDPAATEDGFGGEGEARPPSRAAPRSAEKPRPALVPSDGELSPQSP